MEGDASSRRNVELFREYFTPGCLLVNGLGATETGLTRQFFLHPETPLADGTVPIGYPVADMDALVLDESGNEPGTGTVGQIAIRSRYLAPGYWHQPELTRAAFVPGAPGSDELIYLTGDLGRLRPDGCLEYLGRSYSSLRIRGHRAEPAEVEHALMALSMVREAVFLPSFLFILAGGPLVETRHGQLRFTAPLTAITAAIVGVIVNLALVFAWHVFWPGGWQLGAGPGGVDFFSVGLGLTATVALFRFKAGVIPLILTCGAAGAAAIFVR